jgi:hypothetical protein
MNLKPIKNNDGTFLAKSHVVHNIQSELELIEAYLKLNGNNKLSRFIYTLDDFGQASYTSFHTKDEHELDDTNGYDLTGLEAVCSDEDELYLEDGNGEHKFNLTNLDEFFIRKGKSN